MKNDKLPFGVLELFYPFSPILFYGIMSIIPWIGLKIFIGFYILMFYGVSLMTIIESDKFIYRRETLFKSLVVGVFKFLYRKYVREYFLDLRDGIIYFTNFLNKRDVL